MDCGIEIFDQAAPRIPTQEEAAAAVRRAVLCVPISFQRSKQGDLETGPFYAHGSPAFHGQLQRGTKPIPGIAHGVVLERMDRSEEQCLKRQERRMCDGICTGVSGGRSDLRGWLQAPDWTGTKLMPGRIMVLLVVSGTILGALGLYQPFADWAGAGATVPLLGFGNTLWKGVWKSMGEDGFWESLKAASPPVRWGSRER